MPEISGTVTILSTYTFSNPVTGLLTQTNSNGQITGTLVVASNTGIADTTQPAVVTTQPLAVTSQPPVATIPAGLASGDHTLYQNISSTLGSFIVSVGHNTTAVVGGGAYPSDVSLTTGSSGAVLSASMTGHGPRVTAGAGSHNNNNNNNAASGSQSASASATSASTGGAANPTGLKLASAGMLGLGALVAAVF